MTNFLLREKNIFMMELLLEALNFYHFTQEKYIQWPIVRRHHRLDSQEKGREWFLRQILDQILLSMQIRIAWRLLANHNSSCLISQFS